MEATYNPILHTEAQLISEVRSPDQDCGYRRTPNYVQFNSGLVFQTLRKEITMKNAGKDKSETFNISIVGGKKKVLKS